MLMIPSVSVSPADKFTIIHEQYTEIIFHFVKSFSVKQTIISY